MTRLPITVGASTTRDNEEPWTRRSEFCRWIRVKQTSLEWRLHVIVVRKQQNSVSRFKW